MACCRGQRCCGLIGIKSGCYEGSMWFSIKSARDCFFYIDMYLKKLLAREENQTCVDPGL